MFSSIWTRFHTFTNWPIGLSQQPRELSEAGFFYTQFNDKVTCFQCGGSLHKWQKKSQPWEQHALRYPTCMFVLLGVKRCVNA